MSLLTPAELQTILHNEIPLTKAMGISVKLCNLQAVTLIAELSKNLNHKCTAFGGSLYSVAVLAGWSYLYIRLQSLKLNSHIVIQESQVNYLKPVDQDIIATCYAPSDKDFKNFVKIFKRKSLARITLHTSINVENQDAVIFDGKYVVHT